MEPKEKLRFAEEIINILAAIKPSDKRMITGITKDTQFKLDILKIVALAF